MTFCAQIWSTVAEGSRRWILNIMNAMTINTSRNILIALLSQRRAMDAFLISVINCAVALGASLWNHQSSTQQEFPCTFVCQTSLGVRIMTVRADCSIFISSRKCTLMDTIQGFCVLLDMTLLA